MQTRLITGLIAVTLALAGCVTTENPATDDAPPATGATPIAPRTLELSVRDYAIDAPAEFPAGFADVTLVSEGAEIHHVQFLRLAPGRTVDELTAALAESRGINPSWAVPVGGPNVAAPGAPTRTTIMLEPGEYALICIIPSPSDHVPHHAKGMATAMRIVAGDEPATRAPAHDLTISLHEFGYRVSSPIERGAQTVRVVNEGTQPHEVIVFELFGNATTMELLQWLDTPNATTPPPGRPVGGITPMAPGREAFVPLEFTPGRYTLVCFDVHGTPNGEPHFVQGMIQEFDVA